MPFVLCIPLVVPLSFCTNPFTSHNAYECPSARAASFDVKLFASFSSSDPSVSEVSSDSLSDSSLSLISLEFVDSLDVSSDDFCVSLSVSVVVVSVFEAVSVSSVGFTLSFSCVSASDDSFCSTSSSSATSSETDAP